VWQEIPRHCEGGSPKQSISFGPLWHFLSFIHSCRFPLVKTNGNAAGFLFSKELAPQHIIS
jgi:hypothetical protein